MFGQSESDLSFQCSAVSFLNKLWCCVGGDRNECLFYQQSLIK